jgi:hypothetical protein
MEALEPNPINPYVFIVGCPRSGTTLLKRVLNAHSRIAIIRESPWIEGLQTFVCLDALPRPTRVIRNKAALQAEQGETE